jgi:ribonuclease HII
VITPFHERERWAKGLLVIGIDEAGRGALAGPVAAAAVVFPPNVLPDGLNDSKKLSSKQRAAAAEVIRSMALAWAVALIHHDRIDEVNILQATYDAMHSAIDDVVAQLGHRSDIELLVDGNRFRPHTLPSTTIVGGDGMSPSIAAASILAKTARDQWMIESDSAFPAYGFAVHKGYGTAIHRAAIRQYGPCAIHRQTFLRSLLGQPALPLDHA